MTQFVLASQSPRRVQLLGQFGFEFAQRPAHIDESVLAGEDPVAHVTRLACEKARAAADGALPVLAADTVVVVDEHILGKPKDEADCVRMLGLLSGRTHSVLTAVAIAADGACDVELCDSKVSFVPVSEAQARAYWASGEPRDKAGGYAIQGLAAAFVDHIDGSYTGIMGLPVQRTLAILARHDIHPPVLDGRRP